jgi:DNA replicative helicase MCM subunit Mcm2 (Cdc46/Mcm family)
MTAMGSVTSRWQAYIKKECQSELQELSEQFPTHQSLYIDLIDLQDFDSELAQAVIEYPEKALARGRSVVRNISNIPQPVQLRVENNPHHCSVADITAENLYDLVTVEGIVESVGQINAKPDIAKYGCPGCTRTVTKTFQRITADSPTRCDGCGWDGEFELLPSKSDFIDIQELKLTPPEANRNNGPRSKPLQVYLDGDHVGVVDEGQRYCFTGILRALETHEGDIFMPYLRGLNIRKERDISPSTSPDTVLDSEWDN